MLRNCLFALAVLLGSVGWSAAQPYPRPYPPRGMPRLGGTWFYEGDRNQPCYIRVGPGGSLSLTSEKGSESEGHVSWGGRIVADTWGSLTGDVRGGVIRWHNGTYWTR